MQKQMLAAAAAIALGLTAHGAQAAPARVFDHLVGCWTVHGAVRGKTAHQLAKGQWTLGGKFFLLQLASEPPDKPYQAAIFFGAEDDGHVVAHWLDIFGGQSSKTLGRGAETPSAVDLTFDYPDAPTRNQISLEPGGAWRMRVTETPKGEPTRLFSNYRLTRRTCPAGKVFPL